MTNILEIRDLSKAYGSHTALACINLDVEQGSIFGLLGPNGAGKTTLLRIINSILTKDTGSVIIDGQPAELGVTTKLIGYMPEERGLYPKMRVDDQILYFGKLKGADIGLLRENMYEYMNIFNINEQDRHRRVEELSKGNQQKVQIIATLVHDPKLIILDEPFSGFDPINGQLLQSLIERLQQKGGTIILSSHNMPAIEDMATHIALINKGNVLLHGNLDVLKDSHRTGQLSVTTSCPINEGMALDSGLLQEITQSEERHRHNQYSYLMLPKAGVNNNDILSAISIQANIVAFSEVLPSLTDLFISYTTGNATHS